jgi:hypothetical protein
VAHWGEIPHYIRGHHVQRYIDRVLQIPLFGATHNIIPFPIQKQSPAHLDSRGRKVHVTEWERQPARFPAGWNRLAAKDQDWRYRYQQAWKAKRKALGLPCEIQNPARRRVA